MNARGWQAAVLASCALAGLAGCGHYKIEFDVGDIINAPGDDLSRSELQVDIVCLGKKEIEDLPDIANGSMRANEWFKARDEGDPKIGRIGKDRIFALRRGETTTRDTRVGPPLVSARDSNNKSVTVEIRHPNSLQSEAMVVIYGRFVDRGGAVTKTDPVIIKPLPTWEKLLRVQVGRDKMAWINTQ